VEKLVPVEAQKQVRPVDRPRSSDVEIENLNRAQTLNEFYQIVRDLPMNELNDAQKRKVDAKFNELLRGIQVTDTLQDVPVLSITDSLAINDDIKRLIESAMTERNQLELQKTEFDSRIDALDKKLSGGIANMDAVTREQLLKDIVSLESLLMDNRRQFDRNQADYQLIISSIKERYFNIKILEEKLTVSELLREQEQKEFRQQVILATIALIIFLILIILLARFSNKMQKQQKALAQANNEIRKINESLEERVASRTKLLQEANTELDTFLYRASHDLRTPIASIEGITNLADHLSREEFVKMIRSSTEKMNNLLKNLSVISEINDPAETTDVSVGMLLKKIESGFKSILLSSGVSATWQCPEALQIKTYSLFLEVVISKLVENAIFFSLMKKQAKPEIRVQIIPDDHGLVLIVEDNGVGINESVLPRVSEMFFRGHEESKGSGLGLYMVSRCLRIMKGNLSVESKEGSYTRVAVDVPSL
jgi:signal transduction histidine kinase